MFALLAGCSLVLSLGALILPDSATQDAAVEGEHHADAETPPSFNPMVQSQAVLPFEGGALVVG